jgi:hypothetical protein
VIPKQDKGHKKRIHNTVNGHRCKNTQQNATKMKSNNTLQRYSPPSSGIHPNDARMVQHKQINKRINDMNCTVLSVHAEKTFDKIQYFLMT